MQTLPREYVELLAAVIKCLASDRPTPVRTAREITGWLHQVSPQAVKQAIAGVSNPLTGRVVQCVLENTRHPRLTDWTPEQIADWCHRIQLEDVEAVFAEP